MSREESPKAASVSEEPLIHVLLVEDDARLADLTRTYLDRHGLVVTVRHDGESGLAEAVAHRFDAVLLDLMLPKLDGVEVCRRIRERSDVPIVMITARGEEADRVMGLEIGADDYVAKPFSSRELLARIRAQVRRARGRAGPRSHPLSVEGLELDPATLDATLDGKALDLTSYEFALLAALVSAAGRVLSRERLIELAGRSPDDAFDRSIDVHVSRLRQKLGDDPRHPRRIRTVRGAGYQFLRRSG